MKTAGSDRQVVFLCDSSGIIRKILHDKLDMRACIKPGVMFSSAVHRDSLGKALNFLLEIRTNGSAVGWEFNFPCEEDILSLHFAGLAENRYIMMAGSETQKGLLQFLKDRRKDPEYPGIEGVKGISQKNAKDIQKARESFYFDELTRLTNEITNMHRDLAKKNTEFQRLSELKNQFLGMAAHELKTSMWTIRMYSQFLLEEIKNTASEDQFALLKTIMETSENLKNIVGDYLDIAAIEAGKLQLELAPTDLVELCKDCIRMNGILAERKQIRLNLTHATLPPLNVDAGRIKQVLNNLIHNAVKFSPPQTEIQVDLYRSEEGVFIRVQDEGVGIPPDIADSLFEPFAKGRRQSTEEEKGSGLGLAIARKVVEEHGGRIWVESEVGEGSKFFVSLPLAAIESA